MGRGSTAAGEGAVVWVGDGAMRDWKEIVGIIEERLGLGGGE